MFFLKSVLVVILLINLDKSDGFRKFWRGRRNDGFLGEPSKSSSLQHHLPPSDLWFDQVLDHFDATNNKTWKQRYYTNGEFYKPGGPVFLMIGGEGEATAKWMHEGAWIEYAKMHNAYCFQLEHRYYGKSRPTNDISTKNLIYLSSEYALVDLANFIRAMNEEHKFSGGTKWIAFGGSYPGSLAAWLREKYPHLVHGAISSSGPLLAKMDFVEYYQVVTESLRTYSDACVTAVQKGFQQIDILLKHMIGQRNLNENFKLCTPVEKSVNNILDISNLYENIASEFAGVVQYNKDNSPHAKVTIDMVCDIMTNTMLGPPVKRLAEVNSMMLKSENQTCLDFTYDKMIDELRNDTWASSASEGGRQWTWQTCTEFGFYQTANNPDSLFGDKFPVNFFVRQCTDIFGPRFDGDLLNKLIQRTNTNYGGLNPATTNVLYVHGSIDPWHALGLTQSNDASLPTIYINGTAHCANMYQPRSEDSEELSNARVKIDQFIIKLLK